MYRPGPVRSSSFGKNHGDLVNGPQPQRDRADNVHMSDPNDLNCAASVKRPSGLATREVVDDPPFATGSAADIAIAYTKRYRNHTWDQIAKLIAQELSPPTGGSKCKLQASRSRPTTSPPRRPR